MYKCNDGEEEEEEVQNGDLEEGREPLREEVEWAIKSLKRMGKHQTVMT